MASSLLPQFPFDVNRKFIYARHEMSRVDD
jgi:hypothetical protein